MSKLQSSHQQWEQKTRTLNLLDHSFFDQDYGTVINLEGVIKLLNEVQDEADMNWRYVDLEEDDHSLRLHFVRRRA